ncbi:hypothetical protein LTR53_014064 [Teratosphaeriaceae sp. CCFEE 6253]|nr:hypothetical protein LTR53_014064 [Teratosphaeriaceae sp. CCFEE 6253]
MPKTLENPSQAAKDAILIPLIDAHLNGSLGTEVLDFATALFGKAATDASVKEGKEERKEAFPANGAAVMAVCRSMVRAYVELRKDDEQEGSARELRAIADKFYGKEVVDDEVGNVMMGW